MKNTGKIRYSRWKILSGVIGILLCVVFIPLLIVNLTLIVKGLSRPNDLPAVFHYCPIIEGNDEMTSERTDIKNGDLLLFKNNVTDYKLSAVDGSIVAIKTADNKILVRRLAESSVGADGNEVFLAVTETNKEGTQVTVTRGQIVGVYAFRLGGLGKVVQFSGQPLGIFLLVVLPIMLMFLLLYFVITHDMRVADEVEARRAANAARRHVAPTQAYSEVIVGGYVLDIDGDGNQTVTRVR